jgi:hypothetical protein
MIYIRRLYIIFIYYLFSYIYKFNRHFVVLDLSLKYKDLINFIKPFYYYR